jgi:predicted transcriptional regulator
MYNEAMRTTIELKPEHRAKLLELAARRGEKGFSSIIAEAVDAHLQRLLANEDARRRARLLKGRLSRKEVETFRRATAALRESWR